MKQKFLQIKKLLFIGFFSVVSISTFGQEARVQVIHNSPGAPAVDVWVNGATVLSGVTYRTASSFLGVNAGVTTVQIAVTGSNPYAIVYTDVITLSSNISYRAIATGVVGTTVSGQGLRINYSEANVNTISGQTRMDIYHSSPTAPAVGVVARGVATLVSSFVFDSAPVSVSVAASDYIVDINAGNATGATVASYQAPLSGFSGQSIAIIASGLFPSTFGLIAVRSNGTVVVLPVEEVARVQVIHNSPNAPNVDVWINGSKALPNVAYRTASGFVSLPIMPSPTTVQIATVAPGTTVGTIVFTKTFALSDKTNLRIVASGLLGVTGTQAFDLVNYPANLTTSTGNTGLDIIHSSPNAPTVGVVARGVATLVSAFSFGEQAAFRNVRSIEYTLDVNAGSGSGATVASFTAPLEGFIGQNIAVLASGTFPGTFGLIAVAANGTVVVLPIFATTSITDFYAEQISVYPNPVSDQLKIDALSATGDLSYKLINTLGIAYSFKSSPISVSDLPGGVYTLQILNDNVLIATKKVVIK